ncbi:peptidylprolyl isomerase [Betaproteobacteria bacterium]|nr:peptidylprolyl isomerase [Betaproteobacteria bacterium]GHU24986.1 peptidylprolyl isomerase [Betaproteobacteria bacterium]GHU27736.1 peptidylprolyl isomerase [Betaproteobacteria bacterium]
MKFFPSRLTVALVAGLLAQTGFAAEPIATVNGKAISAERANILINEQVSRGAPNGKELQDQVREFLIRNAVVEQAARAKGLDKKADIVAQIELSNQAVLLRAYVQDWLTANPVTDEDLKKDYNEIKSRAGDKEYNARHVLVQTEDEAKALIAKLDGGAKIADLSKESSLDPGSKENGGDLGWSNPANFVPPFAEALTQLTKGNYTKTPVKTDFGYHVIYLEDVRDLKAPEFDEIKPQLLPRAQQQKVEKHVAELRAKATVK